MTEALGAITGALSVAGLFNNCVESFEYVQLARNFGSDYECCQLKLDVCRNRLSSWGKAAKVHNNPKFASSSPPDNSNGNLEREVLEEIGRQFQSAKKKSLRYETKVDSETSQSFASNGTELSPPGQRIHRRLTASQRQQSTSLAKKTYWALWDVKSFNKLIQDLSYYIGELEDLVPTLDERRLLARRVTQDLNDPHTLQVLKSAAEDCDGILHDASREKLSEFLGRNQGNNLKATRNSTASVGNVYHSSFRFPAGTWIDKTENKCKDLFADDNSSVSVGTVFDSGTPGQTSRFPPQRRMERQ